MSSFLQGFKCFFGDHNWLYDNKDCNHGRECVYCKRYEILIERYNHSGIHGKWTKGTK